MHTNIFIITGERGERSKNERREQERRLEKRLIHTEREREGLRQTTERRRDRETERHRDRETEGETESLIHRLSD